MGERWTSRSLNLSDAATLDAGGSAHIELGPAPTSEAWSIERLSVTTTGSAAEPTVRVYRDSVRTDNFVDGTARGSSDVAEYSSPLPIAGGELIILVWAGGTPGARASVVGQGKRRRVR